MSRNYYSEINLHLTWHTKQSAPLLTARVEPVVHRLMRERIVGTEGVFVHEIGGTENHVHIAVSIAPTILISDFVGQLKGATSHEANRILGSRGKVLQWQTGYGVVSFGTKDLALVTEYIRNQREHHARGSQCDGVCFLSFQESLSYRSGVCAPPRRSVPDSTEKRLPERLTQKPLVGKFNAPTPGGRVVSSSRKLDTRGGAVTWFGVDPRGA